MTLRLGLAAVAIAAIAAPSVRSYRQASALPPPMLVRGCGRQRLGGKPAKPAPPLAFRPVFAKVLRRVPQAPPAAETRTPAGE
jgi:hypothetical protein